MVRLKWDNEDSPMYQTGVSHGVFYGDDGVGHAWSGLVSVTEKPQNNAPTAVYNAMGEKYDNFGNVAEKKHGLACYTYPEVMDDYLGYEYLEDFGFTVDERPPKKFHMAYRVELGNGLYEIHVLLNQIATFGETARQTLADNAALSTITMNLEGAVDPRLGTSHIRLDSRLPITKSAETLLFGDQYTDANIQEFLTAEPVWETVATNYAPIIEPDYDNMVWLGRENLATRNGFYSSSSMRIDVLDKKTSSGNNVIRNTRLTSGNKYNVVDLEATYPSVGDRYVSWVEYEVIEDNGLNDSWHTIRAWLRLYTSAAIVTPEEEYVEHLGGNKYRNVSIWPPMSVTASEDGFRAYLYVYSITEVAIGSVVDIHDYKVELGSTPTAWTPYIDDRSYKPDDYTARPTNYEPGVKRLSTSVNTPASSALAYYDERTSGIGVYSNMDTHNTSSVFLYMYYIPIGTVVDAYYKAHVRNITGPTTGSYFGRMLLADRWVWGPVPNKPGTTEGSIRDYVFVNNPRAVLWNGAPSGTAEVSFSDIMVTNAGTTSEFFDANSTPPTRGDRYVRVPGTHFDYTIHQQLRLRSTSKVKLSDITQYDFWLEAADSMLLSQNETFTFNGPQAVIDGDTFTIDDSIQGYEEG